MNFAKNESGEKWSSTEDGEHFLLGKGGEIKAGFGGKFAGKTPGQAWGKGKQEKDQPDSVQTSPETDAASGESKPDGQTGVNEQAIRATATKLEASRQTLTHEEASIIDAQGNVVGSFVGNNKTTEVSTKHLKDNTLTHNHPMGGTFSPDDIKAFATCNMREIRASCPDGQVYSLKRGESPVHRNFSRAYKGTYTKADKKAAAIADGTAERKTPEWNQIWLREASNTLHEWLSNNAENYGCVYTLEKGVTQ